MISSVFNAILIGVGSVGVKTVAKSYRGIRSLIAGFNITLSVVYVVTSILSISDMVIISQFLEEGCFDRRTENDGLRVSYADGFVHYLTDSECHSSCHECKSGLIASRNCAIIGSTLEVVPRIQKLYDDLYPPSGVQYKPEFVRLLPCNV